MLAEPILVVARVAQAFDALGVSYVVGGSLASSVYGIPRATQDVDLVADLKEPDAERELGNEISDRQWSDILGILKVQGALLDGAYLDRWAPLLDVASLLARARSQQ
jgi:hypothetical protein